MWLVLGLNGWFWIEHQPPKLGVEGSNPSPPAFCSTFAKFSLIFCNSSLVVDIFISLFKHLGKLGYYQKNLTVEKSSNYGTKPLLPFCQYFLPLESSLGDVKQKQINQQKNASNDEEGDGAAELY